MSKRKILIAVAIVAVALTLVFTYIGTPGAGGENEVAAVVVQTTRATTTTAAPTTTTAAPVTTTTAAPTTTTAAPPPHVHPVPAPAPVPAPLPPAPAPVVAPAGSVESIILAAAAEFGVDGNMMLRIARCESGLRPDAMSPSGNFLGLFQQARVYWADRAARLGYGFDDWSNPVANARVSAQMMSEQGTRPWSCK